MVLEIFGLYLAIGAVCYGHSMVGLVQRARYGRQRRAQLSPMAWANEEAWLIEAVTFSHVSWSLLIVPTWPLYLLMNAVLG